MTQYGNYFKVYDKSKLPKAMKVATKDMLKSIKKVKVDPSKIESMEVQTREYGDLEMCTVYWKVKVCE
jgi:hypothetical protein